MLLIDQIAYENRWLTISPEKKSLLYAGLLLLMFLSPPLVQIPLIIGIAAMTIYVAKVKISRYMKWYMIPLPFLLVSILTILLTVSASKTGLLLAIPFGNSFLGIDKTAIEPATQLFFRSFGCLVCTCFYALTVPFQQIIRVMKKCHLPLVFIEITMLMYRFIFILIQEAGIIYHAQEIRFGYRGLKNSYRSFGMLAKLLFVRSLSRYQELSTTLEMKCFQGDFPI